MNYDCLEETYWNNQIDRIELLRQKISARSGVVDGKNVPDDDALSIGDGRRLTMAVMFIDICDFSKRKLEAIEEQTLMLKILNLFFTEMIRISEEYGGNVEKNTGDGLMIYFNDGEGNPPENGAKRSVSCALTMLEATQKLINPIVLASNATPIDFRVSIDYGNVTVAKIGAPRRFNANVAIGTTANFASKMLRMANKNEIVIGASVRGMLPTSWQNNWTAVVPEETGWTYLKTGEPYALYRYFGRWKQLL